jgi:hypothetical protein
MSAPITKYKTNYSKNRIEAVTVERETDTSVWIGTRRVAKMSTYDAYHDSWSAAHTFLLANAERGIDIARQDLEMANGKLGNIKGMKVPQGDKA